MIWQEALPSPRMIEVFAKIDSECLVGKCFDYDFCERETVGEIRDRQPWKSSCVLFSICQESRSFAKEAFSYCFAATPVALPEGSGTECLETDQPEWWEVAAKGVCFQPNRDTIYIRDSDNGIRNILISNRFSSIIDISAIKSLAIDDSLLARAYVRSCLSGQHGILAKSPPLDELIIMRCCIELDDTGMQVWGRCNRFFVDSTQRILDVVAGYAKEVKFLHAGDTLFSKGNGRWIMPPSEAWEDSTDGWALAVKAHRDMNYPDLDRLFI